MKRFFSYPAILASIALPAPAFAQGQFTVKVFEDGTDKPVVSTIEYEASSDNWRPIKATNNNGVLSAQCPGTGRIRANPTALEFSLSDEKTCGGTMELPVARRELSELFGTRWNYSQTASVNREIFGAAYAEAALADLSRNEAKAASPGGGLVENYLKSPDRLSRAEKERAETIILNETSSEFQKIDRDRNSILTAQELATALDRPQ